MANLAECYSNLKCLHRELGRAQNQATAWGKQREQYFQHQLAAENGHQGGKNSSHFLEQVSERDRLQLLKQHEDSGFDKECLHKQSNAQKKQRKVIKRTALLSAMYTVGDTPKNG